MMETKKLTQKDYFSMLRELAVANDRTDLVEFIDGRVELLNKKATSKAPTKNQIANENLKNVIVSALAEIARPATISEIQNANTELSVESGISNQKISALLTQLIKSNVVVRTEDKKKAYFSLV